MYSKTHREKQNEYQRRYWAKNKDRYLAHTKRYRSENPEHFAEMARMERQKNPEIRRMASQKYRKNHKEKVKEQARIYMSFHPEKQIIHNAINAMVKSYGIKKDCRSRRLIGCSPAFFRNHLESLFQPGMTWQNWGSWHVDHIIPLSWFPIKDDPSLLFVASHWSNLQPLWAVENRIKGNRYVTRGQKTRFDN